MGHNLVDDKANEVASALAKRTGVDPEAVRKVLDALGLESSLLHRVYVDKLTGSHTLPNVSHEIIRLSTSQPSL